MNNLFSPKLFNSLPLSVRDILVFHLMISVMDQKHTKRYENDCSQKI